MNHKKMTEKDRLEISLSFFYILFSGILLQFLDKSLI